MSPLFKRGAGRNEEADRIAAFWSWWQEARPQVEAAIDAKDTTAPVTSEIAARVKAIDPGLGWEIGPGIAAAYQLCVTGEGDIEKRALTGRWLAAAHVSGSAWEYYPARQSHPGAASTVLTLDDVDIDFAALRFAIKVDDARERVDVTVWHPAFVKMDERQRATVAFLALDFMLGEDGVERWLGGVTPTLEPLSEAVDGGGLIPAVEAVARTATGDRFALGQATTKGGKPLLVTINTALKHINHLDKPVRLRVSVRLRAADGNGFPSKEESEALSKFEDDLLAAVPNGVYAGRVTGDGRRLLTWFVADADDASSAAKLASHASAWRVDVEAEPDPRWASLREGLLD